MEISQNIQKELRMLKEKLETINYILPAAHCLAFFQLADTKEKFANITENITVSIDEAIN